MLDIDLYNNEYTLNLEANLAYQDELKSKKQDIKHQL